MIVFAIAAMLAAAQPQPVVCDASNDVSGLTCRALAHQSQGRFADSAVAFEQLAALAPATDPQRDRALAAAGNMWIAAGQPGKAAVALDRALSGTGLQAEQRGQALLDRARAAEAQNDLKTARAKVTEAAATISDDPFLWYFSAALAIREADSATAKSSIGRALALAPDDPVLLFEAGHVAHFSGDLAGARDYWTRASAGDPNGDAGKAAREALALLDKPETVQSEQPPTR